MPPRRSGVLAIDVVRDGDQFPRRFCPQGTAGSHGSRGVLPVHRATNVVPLQEGGTGSRSESFDHPPSRPDRYEAGTLNLHGIAGTWELCGISGAQGCWVRTNKN